MGNKGFSLVELLAVLVILATILIIAIPSITSSLTRSEEKDLEKRRQIILSETELKLDNNVKSSLRSGNCSIAVSRLVGDGIITESQAKDKNGQPIEGCIGYNINNELDFVNCVECSPS